MDTAGIVIGSGCRGIFAAGAIKALDDAKVPINAIVGTSSGAQNGAFWCAGQIKEMIDLWMAVKNKDVYKRDLFGVVDKKKLAAYDTSPLRKLLTNKLNYKAIQQSKIPCYVNASDLRAFKTVTTKLNTLQTQDEIVSAIMSSAAFPVAFPEVNGLVDGGLCDDVPAIQAVAHGVERVIIISSTVPEFQEEKTVIDRLSNVLTFMVYCQLNQTLKALEDVKKSNPLLEIVLIEPEKPTNLGPLNFDGLGDQDQRAKIISWGYKRAQEAIKGLVY